MPGHVRASMNWNRCREMYGDKYSMPITDGAKVIVCKLKQNPLGYTSIAYPVDEMRIPEWFKELPFDGDAMETGILDQKLDNLIGVLDWDVQAQRPVTHSTNCLNSKYIMLSIEEIKLLIEKLEQVKKEDLQELIDSNLKILKDH